ncbi:Predicted nucleotidyltransferase component of viral defense system [Saccharopolyspora antimicrobica]|uniref:Nucleotidyltransferase component of viral defense system n=1 Tax=Saccharopolyspora antimicrobica TaxID=455193 RepID=A0A1I4ZPC1_9PSEU|nr:nucleotidyl transferase AbiEii/AbiGii toxin family protein [Saccharopolyspora antimicrobica]RKT83457.1 putative nucleotidyltransferase component of viral defense system [Saccharopolyspora antimicrobica]SFN51893.1 Predicted nucleotidyltransferase component of viral defense system [Saccharopolyspora antimicrobica]
MNKYGSPHALQKAVGDRARRLAREHGVTSTELVNRFFLQRLLARVFRDDTEGWLLKGGQALLVRYQGARHSRDIDLLFRDDDRGLSQALEALRRAAASDLGDHVSFEFVDSTDQIQGRPSRKVRFAAMVGLKEMTTVSVDLVVGLAPLGEPVAQRLRPVLGIEFDEHVQVRLYPLTDHIADKICAMYERHRGRPSSRVKDLVDLVVIALREEVDGLSAQLAIRREVARRQHSGTDIELPEAFTVPDPASWAKGYRSEARTVVGLEQYRTLGQAQPLAELFISPLLVETVPGRWHPGTLSWN